MKKSKVLDFELDNKRRKIIEVDDDIIVIGGPGSGKTTISLLKGLHFIKKKSFGRGQKVLFLSFSRNAKSRIEESLKNLPSSEKFSDSIVIKTFHSFFLDIVKSHGYLLGSRKQLNVIPPHDEAIIRAGRDPLNEEFLKELKERFIEEGQITFDMFSEKAEEILHNSNRIIDLYARMYPLIIVDEAQDTDFRQWSIVSCFARKVRLVILADLKQQIYDYRQDVNPKRLEEIKSLLKPVIFNLENENYRSPDTEILHFAQDLFAGKIEHKKYDGVLALKYSPRSNNYNSALGRALKAILRDSNGEKRRVKSIAILCKTNAAVKKISKDLRSLNIEHKYQFDEVATNISSRIIACLMEPILDEKQHLLLCLFIIKEFYDSKGNKNRSNQIEIWIKSIKTKKPIRGTFVKALKKVVTKVNEVKFTGNPGRDWRHIQSQFSDCGNNELIKIAQYSENLVAFNRGKLILNGLTKAWDQFGVYANARIVLQEALIETQISSISPRQTGINLMNMHQSKGKEFDGVIIYENPYSCPLEQKNDNQNSDSIKKLMFVACTRARVQLVLLTQHGSSPKVLRNLQYQI